MSKLAFGRPEMAIFDPNLMAVNDAKADAVITWARRVKDWPTLEEAVDIKIEDQAEFIEWWRETVRGPGGREAQAIGADRGELVCEAAEAQTGIKHQQVSRWRHYLSDKEAYRERLLGAEYKAAALMEAEGTNIRGTQGTGDNEWFTPPENIKLAREVLGEIDLDPASHRAAQNAVRARNFFTLQDDGLTKEWRGRVWLNPPYAQPAIGHFVDKLTAVWFTR